MEKYLLLYLLPLGYLVSMIIILIIYECKDKEIVSAFGAYNIVGMFATIYSYISHACDSHSTYLNIWLMIILLLIHISGTLNVIHRDECDDVLYYNALVEFSIIPSMIALSLVLLMIFYIIIGICRVFSKTKIQPIE